ncbi:hypothetical protein [Nostoc sp. DedSLP04]|uniref:hypothetical protein n=1 Tax=Nostoc sp. DedSLP04 TaxID=3075401 RepID=UPI002AD43796|nr:hypothetical protein [Nostoc sp. DedSLP04]MDZ8031066.1 hypothetical protein [Nostoc sp. DedSLP04]
MAIALFNEPQRRREHRVRRERSLFLTNHRGAENIEEGEGDRTMEILQAMPSLREASPTAGFAYAFLTNRQDAKEE